MKLICNDCGHVFDESEWGDYGECPSCNSADTEEARECPICGEYHNGFLDGHLIWCCPECFEKAFTRDNFKKYATSRWDDYDAVDVLEDFIMYEVFDIDQELKHSSLAFKEHCSNIYDDLSKPDAYGVFHVDDLIKDYFYRVPDCYSDFSEWLVEEHRKAAKT
jgi:predicted  nucleic acid-binding Zn-ribbon protein